MKKNLLSLCLSLALTVGAPLAANADTPANVSVAPAISAATLQSLPWQPLQPPVSQEVKLDAVSPQLNQGEIQGAIAAYTLPADRGSLEVTLSSLAKTIRCTRRAYWCWMSICARRRITRAAISRISRRGRCPPIASKAR